MQSNAGPNAGPAQKQASPEPAQSGAFATSAVKSQGGAPARRPQRSALLRVPAWLRWALIALLLGLIALASIVAARQAPHPDMFRKVGVWDFAAPGWWAYPLERNAFKRTVVHGHLYAVFALPGTGKLWAVGDGGLIVHSADDGATWVQQRPVAAAAAGGASAAKRRTSAWSWLPQATAASPDPKAQSSGRPEAQQQQPLQKQQQPPQQQQQQLPPEQAQQPLLDKSESSRAPPTPPSMTRPEQSGVAEQASGKAAPPQKAAATPAQKAPPAPPAALPASAPAAQAADAKLEAPAAPPQPTPVVPVTTESATLNGVHFAADGVRGWAVGDGSTIVATRDGGKQWADPAPYRLTWAPWYFATLPALALALFGVLAFVEPVRRGEAAADEQLEDGADGAGTFLRSDQPVADKAFDRLGVRPVVEALSSFIRNRGTEPRVTIAVTGEWGNGKSSVMRMLQTDLDRAGFRSAWFNAWHHQQEGRPLSALFNVVRQQAVPQWWRQPLAALRVRSRLIWGRGAAYKLVAVATALALALAAGDMFADGWRVAFDNARHFVRHHVLQKRETAITGASLAKLDPFSRAAPAPAAAGASKAAAAAGASARNAGAPAARVTPPVADACETKTWPAGAKAEPLRPEVYCYLKRNLVWDEGGDASRCGVQHDPPVPRGRECVFAKAEDLIKTIEARDARAERSLWPSEKKAIRAAAETLPPPPLFPWLEGALVGGAAAFLALLFTKGISVYGLQLTAPLRALLAAATGGRAGDEGKESSGTVERYRAEFGLLCDALDGRLVIFIDDLDRCSPETVNGVLELTNYLADISRCFIVIGAAMERVLRCVRSPVASDDHTAYATAYLRKLVHIELPVPQNRQLLERLAAADPTTTPTHEVRSGLRRWAWRAALGAAALAALLASFYGGKLLHDGAEGVALRVNPVVARAEPVIDTPAAAAPNTEAIALQPRTSRDSEPVGLAATPPPTVPLDWLAAAALLGAAALAWRWWRRNRETVVVALGGAVRDEDSDRFMRALQIWNPVVVSYDPTPRHVKRFYNRARLFAAYEREHAGADAARDESLVAMAAMHHLDPALLPSLAAALGDDGDDGDRTRRVQAWVTQSAFESGFAQPPNDDDRQRQALRERLLDAAWTAHIDAFGTAPSAEQVRRFERSVEGILVR